MVDISELNQVARAAQIIAGQHQRAVEAVQRIVDGPAVQEVIALENSAGSHVLAELACNQALVSAAQGPLEELHRAGIFDQASDVHETLCSPQEMMDAFNARFILPEVSISEKLMQEFQHSPAAGVLARYATRADEIQRAMEAMHTPWLDEQEMMRSVAGFAEIQGIGSMLTRMPGFDETVSEVLRVDLGDWRDKITWPEPVLTDMDARGTFYIERGFDPYLTDFPAPAFRESTEIAGLRREPPSLVDAYGEPVPRAENYGDEKALVLTNVAHDWLQRFESNLRNFIDEQMTEVFGPNWPKHQLPKGMYERWMEKREAAAKRGRAPKPLIAFADFTDYERVICKKDNWRQVFSSFFNRPESVRESFQRMHPIRLDTMHARPIAQDDELLLYVEVRRLIRVIFG